MLKKCLLFITLLSLVVVWSGGVRADEAAMVERMKKMEEEIAFLKKALMGGQGKPVEVPVEEVEVVDKEREKKLSEMLASYEKMQGSVDEPATNEFYFAKKTQELQDKGLAPWFGGVETKSFLDKLGRNTYLGGYMDFELRIPDADQSTLRQTPNTPASSRKGFDTFRQFRFIPFIYSDVSDRIKLSAELEFEFGGVGGGRAGEVIVEFANIDFLISDWINWRGGVILSPLGKLNLVHDTPLQDMVDRPMVDQMIIPTTLSEVGMGLFGEFYVGAASKFNYEIYVVNGFEGLDKDGNRNFSRTSGLGGSNGGYRENGNNSFDTVGRLAYSPFLGLELGGSFHTGRYDEKNDNRMTIAAFDWTYQRGPFEFVGEIARDYITRDAFAKAAGITGDMWGYYAEVRYHFLPSLLQRIAPTFFTDESTFTAVLRHGHVETESDDQHFLRDRLTVGLNYRITEDTVFKVDYQVNTEHKALPSNENNELLFQVSTYF